MKSNAAVLALVICLALGCSKETKQEVADLPVGDFLELVPRYKGPIRVGKPMTVAELAPEDALVVVNGYPLTRKTFDELMVLKAQQMMKKRGANPTYVQNEVERFKTRYPMIFVAHRLLIDKARELKVLSDEELAKKVNETVNKAAAARKQTVEKFKKAYPGDFKYFTYEVAEQYLIDALVRKHVPPKCVVDDNFITNCQAQIAADNAQAVESNRQMKVTMAGWKRDLQAGKCTFETLAQQHSQDDSGDAARPGFWGDFERGEFDDKNIQAAVFAMKVGEVTDPIEDEDGIHLVKLLKVMPAVKNEKGRVISNEVRSVAHIYREKEPLMIIQDRASLMADLKHQMQMQALDDYVGNLKTGGVYKVVYPHGEALFKHHE